MKRKVILVIISILILTLSIIGLTYAFMRPQVEKKEEKSNITIKACAKIQLKDNGSFINLENTYPMDDEMGLETKPYEFTITSTCEDYVGFNLYLTSLTTNDIEDSAIHFAITSKEGTVLVSNILSKTDNGLNDFNSNELSELDKGIKGTHKNIYKVYSNNIPLKGESEYKLYLWLDKDASNDTMGKNFNIGLSVKSFNRGETLAEYLIRNKDNTLIYHDGLPDYEEMPNSNLEAGDLAYRFVGNNPKNYVCLDNKETDDCDTDEDLYRIIGLFQNELNLYEIKLIKAEGATANQLGDNTIQGAASYNAYSSTWGEYQSYYKGTNYNNLANYTWNNINSGNSTNMWQYSNLNKINLNQFYYNYITNRAPYLQNHITEHTWTTGGTSNTGNGKDVFDSEIGSKKVKINDSLCYAQGKNTTAKECTQEDIEYRDHIGLMYISDYMYGTLPLYWTVTVSNYNDENTKKNNWLYLGIYEWTISRYAANGYITWYSSAPGYGSYYLRVYNSHGARPSFYLMANTKLKEGEGSKEKPYRITFE